MDSEDRGIALLPAHLRTQRDGVQCERAFRCFGVLIHDWCLFKREVSVRTREDTLVDGPDNGPMRAIPFDKLAVLAYRIWNETYARATDQNPDDLLETDLDDVPRFPYPFREIPGTHGRGLGRVNASNVREKPGYLLDMLFGLQKLGVLPYFDIKAASVSEDDLEEGEAGRENPGHYLTTIEPAITIGNYRRFLSGFNRREADIVVRMGNAFRHLNPSEVRALGTHQNYRKTYEDVIQEFHYARYRLSRMARRISDGASFLVEARRLREVLNEACRKSKYNQKTYGVARGKLANLIQDVGVRTAFVESHAPVYEIWGVADMVKLARESESLFDLSGYLFALAYFNDCPKALVDGSRTGRAAREAWEVSIRAIEQLGVGTFPRSPQEAFVTGTGDLSSVGSLSIRDLIEAIRVRCNIEIANGERHLRLQ